MAKKKAAPKKKKAAPKKKKVVSKNKKAAPKKKKAAPKKKKAAPKKKKAAPKKKKVAPKKKKAAPKKKKAAPNKKKAAPKKKKVAPKKKVTPKKKEAAPKKKVTPKKKEATPKKKVEAAPKNKKAVPTPVKKAEPKAKKGKTKKQKAEEEKAILAEERRIREKEELRQIKAALPESTIKKFAKKVEPKPYKNTDSRTRYSDKELGEFKALILKKLDEAKKDYELLKNTLSHKDDHGTDDTSPTFKLLEDGSDVLSREETAHLASRQEKFIQNLKNALIRIENKTYGVCRVTGKLISKERLRSVPHATLSIDAKLHQD